MLDEQVMHKQMLVKQGTMTQMEKNLNKEELKGFKKNQIRPNAMIPGIFSESPLRKNVPAGSGSGIQSLNSSPRKGGMSASMDNIDYKTVRTVPNYGRYKRAISNIQLNNPKQEMNVSFDYQDGSGMANS